MKTLTKLCCLFLLATAPCIAQPATQGENIELRNLDFKSGIASWGLRNASKLDAVYRAETTPDGLPALAVHLDDNSPDALKKAAYIARRDLPTAQGYYQLHFRMRTDLSAGSAGLRLMVEKTDGTLQAINIPGQGGAPLVSKQTPWQNYFLVYRIGEPVKNVIIQFETRDARGSMAVADMRLERFDDATGAKLYQQMNPTYPSAAQFGAKLVGTPCRVINAIGKKMLYQPPGMDYPILVLNSCTSVGTGSAVFVDYVKGTSTVVPFPKGAGGWDIIEVAPGKLLFESLGPVSLYTIDTTGGNYKIESVVDVPQSQYAWSFAKGPQGEIYFGSYPSGNVYRYDHATRKVSDLGYIGPEGNLYARHVAVDDRGYLLVSMSVSKPNLVAYNLATKEQTVVAPGKSGGLVNVAGRVYVPIDKVLHEFDAPSMKFVPAKLPAPPANITWQGLSPNSTTQRFLLLGSDGNWYETAPTGTPKQVWNLKLEGGTIVGHTHNNQLLAFRGQEYAVVAPNAKKVPWKQVTDKAVPVSMHFLSPDPKGGVTSGPNFGQTLVRFDPARKLEQNTGQVVDGGGEVYDGLWLGDEFHFVAYSGGYQAVWNPDKPWRQMQNENPRTIVQYNVPDYDTVIRPIGGIVTGPGGKLYTGWAGAYGKTNGTVTEFDPKTEKVRFWSNKLIDEDASIGKVASDGKYIYGLTSNYFSGIKPAPKPIYFFVLDPQTEQVVYKQKLEVTAGANLVHIPGTNNVWLALPGGVQRFDPASKTFGSMLAWPKGVGNPGNVNSTTSLGSNGWLVANDYIVKLSDGATPELNVQFKMPMGAHITAGYDGQLYFTQKQELWAAPLK